VFGQLAREERPPLLHSRVDDGARARIGEQAIDVPADALAEPDGRRLRISVEVAQHFAQGAFERIGDALRWERRDRRGRCVTPDEDGATCPRRDARREGGQQKRRS
jgi:hypothetical protein